MNEHQEAVAKRCLDGAYDGSMAFPAIIGALLEAGFEGYDVDYRRGLATYFLPSGEALPLATPKSSTPVAAAFQGDVVAAAIRAAQIGAPGYTYVGFCEQVKAAGCAGYFVSFLGKRVVYFGRTGELHVEHFPQS